MVMTYAAEPFTSKERDAETGLDFFGARYMSSAQGRFTSPDEPLEDQDPSDPQSWNLFGYVRNNPLRFTDADGRTCVNGKDEEVTPVSTRPSSVLRKSPQAQRRVRTTTLLGS